MSDGGDANAAKAKAEDEQGTSSGVPKTTPVLWADMSDGDDEDDEYVSAHRSAVDNGRPGTGGVNRSSGIKSGGGRLESRAISGGGGGGRAGGGGGSGQRQIGGQRSYGRGPILERRGSRSYALTGGTPSNMVVQHGAQGLPVQQRRQPGLHNRSGNITLSRNQSATLSHASSPIARKTAKATITDIPQVDPGAPYRLYVTPISLSVTPNQIRDAFSPIKLKQVEISTRNDKMGFAFIEVFSYDDMVLALSDLQNQLIGENRISIRVQRRKDPSTFKVARSVGQLSDKPSDRDSERGITPPRTEGTHKGHKKALLCMLASDNDNTTRDTKIFGTGKPREEKWEEPPPVAEAPPPEPAKSTDSHKEPDLSHPAPEQRPPPPPPAETPSFVAKSPLRQPADSGSDSMHSSNVQRTIPTMPDAEDRHPVPRQQFQDVPHLTSMPPMTEMPRRAEQPTFSPPPPADMMMNYGMMPKPYLAAAPAVMDMPPNHQGYRYPPDQQYQAMLTPQMYWASPDEFSQPPMGPRMAPPPDRPHHLPGTWTDNGCVPHIGHPLIQQQQTQPVMMGGYDLIGMRPQGLQMMPLEPVHATSMSNSGYFESNGVRPPEEVVTMPMTYAAARGPSPRQGPEPMMSAGSNGSGFAYCRPAVLVPNSRGPSPAINPIPKRASPPPPMPPPRYSDAPLPPASHPSSASYVDKVPSPPSSIPTVSPPQQMQSVPAITSNKSRAEPPPPTAPHSRPSYASVVGADKKPRSSSSGTTGPAGEAISFVPPASVESGATNRGNGNVRGSKGRGSRNQARRNQQTNGRVWMKQSSSHETETAAESTRNKIGHSDSCSTDDFLEFAKGRKRS